MKFSTSSLLHLLCAWAVDAVLHYETTPNGFTAPARGWNSFGMQTLGNEGWVLNQQNVLSQCAVLAAKFSSLGYKYCSIDSGWSQGSEGDEYGRIIANASFFPDMGALATKLHDQGLELGIYINPGAFANDADKLIYGTSETLRSVMLLDNTNYLNGRWNLNWTLPAAQAWCDSNVELWASWGVDYIKLDFVTPGSPNGGLPAGQDTSGSVSCYHNAIAKVGRPMWLAISWGLDWTSPSPYNIWNSNADSMRVDMDVQNTGAKNFLQWKTVQRTIDKYRQYVLYQVEKASADTLTIYPDMDNLYAVNNADLTGLTDTQRRTMVYHWIGAGANLILGSDLSKLDAWGVGLLNDPALGSIADFAAKYPMRPLSPGDANGKGSQVLWWLAGPDPTTGTSVVMLVNYGASGDNSLYDPAPVEGTASGSILLNTIVSTSSDIDHWNVEFAAKSFQTDRTLTDGIVNGSAHFNISVLDGDAVMFLATPVIKSNAKRDTEPQITLSPTKSLGARNEPTTVLTQSTYPLQSPGCQTNPLNGTVPKGVDIENGTISSAELLYAIRSVLCTDVCDIPAGIPASAATTQQSGGAVACEISIEVSDTIEAWGYRGTLPDGIEAQECWDSTAYIIERCIVDTNQTTGWWNGDHVYQFYQMGFRPLNFNDTYHVQANDLLTSALTTVSTVPSFSTNPFASNTTAAGGPTITTLPTAAATMTTPAASSEASAAIGSASASPSATSDVTALTVPVKHLLAGLIFFAMWL